MIIDPVKKFRRGFAVVRHTRGYKIRNVTRIEKNRYLLIPTNLGYNSEEIRAEEGTWLYVPVKVISVRDL